MQEARRGDPEMAQARLWFLEGIPSLEVRPEALALAQMLLGRRPLPEKAAADALHIAVATINGVEFLLTWNCKHIANAEMRPLIERVCRQQGYEPPVLCTPEEL